MQTEFRGCFTVAVTPFAETPGQPVDVAALEGFVDWQLAEEVPGLIFLGTTGEFLTLTAEERDLVIDTAVRRVAGRVPVLIGTMDAYTPKAVAQSRRAVELGADGLMILPPYYYTPTEDEIVKYYRAISEAVDVPIMLYNNPVTSNVDMSARLVARLTRDFENIRYIKESSRELARVRQVIDQTDGVMNVFAGEHFIDSYLLGAIGYVNPYGNYVPRPSKSMYDLMERGQVESARRIGRLIDELDAIIAEGHPTYGHQCYSKALARRQGHPVGDVRPPLTTFGELGAEGEQRLRRIGALMDELSLVTAEVTAGTTAGLPS